jgi:uncharacterized membrane protein YbhN (UPF0104 family)
MKNENINYIEVWNFHAQSNAKLVNLAFFSFYLILNNFIISMDDIGNTTKYQISLKWGSLNNFNSHVLIFFYN